jgi:hypothetical protein
MPDHLIKVSYGLPREAGFQRSQTCTLPFSKVVERLRNAIEVEDPWILYEIDPQALLRAAASRLEPRGRYSSSIRVLWRVCSRPIQPPYLKRL